MRDRAPGSTEADQVIKPADLAPGRIVVIILATHLVVLPQGPWAAELKILEDCIFEFLFAKGALGFLFLLRLCRVCFDLFSGLRSFCHCLLLSLS